MLSVRRLPNGAAMMRGVEAFGVSHAKVLTFSQGDGILGFNGQCYAARSDFVQAKFLRANVDCGGTVEGRDRMIRIYKMDKITPFDFLTMSRRTPSFGDMPGMLPAKSFNPANPVDPVLKSLQRERQSGPSHGYRGLGLTFQS